MTLQVWRSHHPLWLAPHRPFFLLAGLWAFMVPLVWLLPQGLAAEPVAWHRHEMLYGMGGAAVGGYLLTALAAWTGDGPVSPQATRLVVALWLVARLTFATGLHAAAASAATAGYFGVLGVFLLQRVIRAKAWRRLLLAAAPLGLGTAALAGQQAAGFIDEAAVTRLLPLLHALLISLVGGPALTAFTIHWAGREGAGHGICNPRWTGLGARLTLVAAIGGVLLNAPGMAGLLAIASGVQHLACVLAWRSWRALAYPALLLLHLAWLWLGIGLVLMGYSLSQQDTAAALHALTMGAMGTMMLAIMGRAAMVRRGTRLLVSFELAAGFGLVCLSVPIRLCVPFVEHAPMLQIAAASWMAGWALFLWDFRRALRGPVPRPVLSAATGRRPA